MKIIRFLAAACLCFLATNAFAAKCYVKEYSDIAQTVRGAAQIAAEPALVDQTAVDFTAGHAESVAFNASTRFIRVWCDAQASYLVGAAPIATNAMSPLSASLPEYFAVTASQKISFVANP